MHKTHSAPPPQSNVAAHANLATCSESSSHVRYLPSKSCPLWQKNFNKIALNTTTTSWWRRREQCSWLGEITFWRGTKLWQDTCRALLRLSWKVQTGGWKWLQRMSCNIRIFDGIPTSALCMGAMYLILCSIWWHLRSIPQPLMMPAEKSLMF